jgi:PAS domain S-box-containing protein
VDEAKLAAPDGADPYFQLQLLAAIVESSDDAIVSKSLEGRILSWNRGAARIFGYEPHEVIGKPITVIIPVELHEEERHILEKLSRGERIDHYDTMRLTKDGRRIPISLTVSPIRDSRGAIVGASKVARDISERKQVEQAVYEREEALRDADRRKNEFLAQLAHELRNSLAPIRYALAAGKKADKAPLRSRAEEIIERQVGHMSHLLDDLLDISRITHGVLELKKGTVDLRAVLDPAIETARPLLTANRHRLSVELPAERVLLAGDAIRLSQVFSNLLINAAKYTDPGGDIRVQAVLEGREVKVAVRDNGMGISQELMPHIFGLYSRGRMAAQRGEAGLGIGLSLVHAIVRLHGGSVEARSDGPGKGSEFLVRLPVANQP